MIEDTLKKYHEELDEAEITGNVTGAFTVKRHQGENPCKSRTGPDHVWHVVHSHLQRTKTGRLLEETVDWCERCGSLRIDVKVKESQRPRDKRNVA